MSRPVVVVEPGHGHRVGNVEFLARSVDTPFFNLAIIVIRPGQGVEAHRHEAEDDSFLVLEGTLSLTVGDDDRNVQAEAGTFVLVPIGTLHAIANSGPTDVRFLNVHAPGGFDRRIALDDGRSDSSTKRPDLDLLLADLLSIPAAQATVESPVLALRGHSVPRS